MNQKSTDCSKSIKDSAKWSQIITLTTSVKPSTFLMNKYPGQDSFSKKVSALKYLFYLFKGVTKQRWIPLCSSNSIFYWSLGQHEFQCRRVKEHALIFTNHSCQVMQQIEKFLIQWKIQNFSRIVNIFIKVDYKITFFPVELTTQWLKANSNKSDLLFRDCTWWWDIWLKTDKLTFLKFIIWSICNFYLRIFDRFIFLSLSTFISFYCFFY